MDSSQSCFVEDPGFGGQVFPRYVASATVDYEAGGGWREGHGGGCGEGMDGMGEMVRKKGGVG